MGYVRSRMRGGRPDSLRRSRNSTRIPSSLRKELLDLEDNDTGGDSAGGLGKGEAPQTYGLAQHGQLSRKERRKRLRAQQRQQKNEHQRLRKRQLKKRGVGAVTGQQYRGERDNNAQPPEDEATESVDSGPAEIDEEGRGSVDSEYLDTGWEEDIESVRAAAAALQKAQKRQRRGDDPLHKELRMLERKLGITSNKSHSRESARARAKLRSELEADGFDLELQDVLDNILGSDENKGEGFDRDKSVEGDGVEEPEAESDCAPVENAVSERGSNRFSHISDEAPLQCKETQSSFKTAIGQRGRRPELPTKAAATAHFQQHQKLHTGGFESAPDALASGAAANSIRKQAALLRFNTELQQSLFECFVTANSPDDALQLLQNSGYLSMKKTIITQTVAVAMQCCLQEKFYNQFYGVVLSRLCGICGCQASQNDCNAVCRCFRMREKGAARYRRTIVRGLAAQASAAHGFSVRRLLNLAKLTAFLDRVEFSMHNFRKICGRIRSQLSQICVELLCCPTAAASPLPAGEDWEQSAVAYFSCLGPMTDICDAFITLLQDVVLPSISADSAGSSTAERALKTSVVKSTIRTLLANRKLGM